jgi:type IV secretory pathway VirB4 component
LQRTTILLLTELIWRDLAAGTYPRTLIVFDEVWRFFAQSRVFLEEMYRTFRKYKAGIVSITQNLADYGDDSFAKMLFTNSFTKIFLQNGASADYLKNTFDLPESDISRALSVVSQKPNYSEFFALIFASIMEVVASVSGFAFCKNSRDIQDEIEAEQRKRKHERHMAQVKAAMERNERRNALARQRRAELRTAPALHLVRS